MKHLNSKIVLFVIIVAILSIKCSDHCDDEDLRRDKELTIVTKHKDSIEID